MHPKLERRRLFVKPFSIPQPALFLDRDGVLIEDRNYLLDPNEVKLCTNANDMLVHASQQGEQHCGVGFCFQVGRERFEGLLP